MPLKKTGMELEELFRCLEELKELGTVGAATTNAITDAVDNVKKRLKITKGFVEDNSEIVASEGSPADIAAESSVSQRIHKTVFQLLACANENARYDCRLECGCLVVAILQEILHLLESAVASHSESPEPLPPVSSSRYERDVPPAAPPDLISVHNTKVVEAACRLALYTVVLSSLGPETSIHFKFSMRNAKFILGTDVVAVSPDCKHSFLAAIIKFVIPIMKHETLGLSMRGMFFPEYLSAMLELCFSPGTPKLYADDTRFFRQQLTETTNLLDKSQVIKTLLLLKGQFGMVTGSVWLRKLCGSLLVRHFLLQPEGVASTVGVALTMCDSQDWKRLEAVASLVANAPFNDMDLFFSSIGPQISELLQQDSVKSEVRCVLVLVLAQLAKRSATLTSVHVTNTLLSPLLDTTTNQSKHSKIEEVNVTKCVTMLHNLYIEVAPSTLSLTSLFRPVLSPLVAIASLPTTHLRSKARQIIVRYLSHLPSEESVRTLLTFANLETSDELPTLIPDLTFSVDDSGGVKVTRVGDQTTKNVLEEDENLSLCLVSILEAFKDFQVVLEFYRGLASCIDFTFMNEKQKSPTMLFTQDDERESQVSAMRRVYLVSHLLGNLADNEQLTNKLFENNLAAAISFVDTLFQVSHQKCEDEGLRQTQITVIMNAVMLMSCCVGERLMSNKISSTNWKELTALLPSLDNISHAFKDEALHVFVDQLRNLILTHGVVGDVSGENRDQVKSDGSVKCSKKSDKKGLGFEKQNASTTIKHESLSIQIPAAEKALKQEPKTADEETSMSSNTFVKKEPKSNVTISNIMCSAKHEEKSNLPKNTNENKEKRSSYKEAMEDLFSPHLPIRGHALLSLGKLVEQRDGETLSKKGKLLSIFQHNLKDEDSYIYLMAVQGLAVMCDVFPEKVVKLLTAEFTVGERSIEDRIKLAEVMTRATRRLGALLPHYKDHFINALLTGVRDTEALVRAASLSNLGEVCKQLHFSLGPIVHEIFEVLKCVVEGDKAPEARRAAVMVVTLILQGLGRDSFTVLREVMRDLYRALRLVHAHDPDDVVKLHAQLAIEEIDTITKEFLLPKLSLTKKIYVTDMTPSNPLL